MEHMTMSEQPLEELVAAFLTDLAHANRGVSLPTIRKRLGQKNLQTTLRSAEQSDAPAASLLLIRRRAPTQITNAFPLGRGKTMASFTRYCEEEG